MKMRGQAHVVYRDIQTATQAMRALQGFELFGKEMVPSTFIFLSPSKANRLTYKLLKRIQYAKSKSDAIARLDGTFRMPAAAAGAVVATELQQSIFNAPPSAAISTALAQSTGTLKPPAPDGDHAMEDTRSPTTSVAGQKRRRDEENDEPEEDSEGDVAMDEDSDDE